MKKIFCLFLILPFLTVSCSDDEKDNENFVAKINPSAVFTGGQLKNAGSMAFTYNAEGLLTEIDDEGQAITFTYGENIKTEETLQYPSDVTMKYKDEYNRTFTIYMKLGRNGFVKSCVQVCDSKYVTLAVDKWTFKYNSSGQLVEMKHTEADSGGEKDVETTAISYKDGNIVKVANDHYSATINYTSENHKKGIKNKGCMMLFNATFSIDLGEMEYAYYAGILGKSTKQLPLQVVHSSYKYPFDFEWIINEKDYPTKFVWFDGYYTDSSELKW